MAAISDLLRHDLRNAEFSEGYAESHLSMHVAAQIKVLREQRDLTQEQLAEKIGTTQTAISRIENVNYSKWNVRTLIKLARAFDVRLRISFETFGSLIEEVEKFGRKSLERAPRNLDPILYGKKKQVAEISIDLTDRQRAPGGELHGTVKALLGTPPPPAGHPSTRKQKPKRRPKRRAKRKA